MINKGHGLIGLPNASLATTMDAFTFSLAKKCERLATASYLVTSFLSDIEPLKTRLRALALDLVRDASLVRHVGMTGETQAMEIIRANISETLSLLELAFISGLVSEMNFSILKREYASLRDAVEIKKASRDSRTDSVLDNNFFGASEPVSRTQRSDLAGTPEGRAFMHPAPALSPRSDLKKFEPKVGPLYTSVPAPMSDRNPKGHASVSNLTPSPAPIPRSSASSPRLSASAPASSTLSTNDYQLSASVVRDSRHTRILKLIKDKREVAIKDIMEHFPELSEKTIQRDLVSFTESGVLKKSGDRRWSRYVLA